MAPLRNIIDACLRAIISPSEHREIEVNLKDIKETTLWRALNKSLRDKGYRYEEVFCGIARQEEVNNVRRKILFYSDRPHMIETKMMKVSSTTIDNTSYTVKCSAETEAPLQVPIATILQSSMNFGYRYRISFDVNEYFRIDMTQLYWFKPDARVEYVDSLTKLASQNQLLVDPEVANHLSTTEYQCEVEFVKLAGADVLTKEFTELYPILQMSPLFVTRQMRERLDILYSSFGTKFMVEARNLKVQDLTGDALLKSKDPYTFTLKADGERKLLILNSDGMWLNYPPHLSSLISTEKFDRNSVYDCEVVNGRIYVFDCLMFNDTDVRDRSHDERLSYYRDLPGVQLKKFEKIRTAEDFFNIMNRQREILIQFALLEAFLDANPKATEEEILQHTPRSEEGFPIDGFMFTPGGKYNTGILSTNLVKNPMVCKWKPTSLLTIDFHLRLLDDGRKGLFSYNEESKLIEVFRGTERFPYIPENLNQDQFVNVSVGTIVEMRYSKEQFYLYRTRENKNTANSLRVAIDNWKDIREPLSAQTLCGSDFKLVRKYHNRLKRNLLNTSIDRNSVILDIGSGVGGDLQKFAKAKHIYLVEPNDSNLIELNRRIDSHKMRKKVTVIHAKFEETEKIRAKLTERINLVTSMFSLTFFWESREMLRKFVHSLTSLAPDARFLFATMEGHAVLASQRQSGQWQGPKLIMDAGDEQAVFERKEKEPNKGHAIDVQIPGETVEGVQREYLVFLSDLRLPSQYKLQLYGKASEELLLPPAAKLYSSFYVFCAFGVDKSVESALTEQFETMRIVTESGERQDDKVSGLIVSGYDKFSFKCIGNIGLIGAILKAVSQPYQELQSIEQRKKFCAVFQKHAHDTVIQNWAITSHSYLLETTILAIHRHDEFPPLPSEIQTRLSNSQFTKYEVALFSEILKVNIVILTLGGSVFHYAENSPPLCEGRQYTLYILKNGDFYDNILLRFNSSNFFVAADSELNDLMQQRIGDNVRTLAQWNSTASGFKAAASEVKNSIRDCAVQSDPAFAQYLAAIFQQLM